MIPRTCIQAITNHQNSRTDSRRLSLQNIKKLLVTSDQQRCPQVLSFDNSCCESEAVLSFEELGNGLIEILFLEGL